MGHFWWLRGPACPPQLLPVRLARLSRQQCCPRFLTSVVLQARQRSSAGKVIYQMPTDVKRIEAYLMRCVLPKPRHSPSMLPRFTFASHTSVICSRAALCTYRASQAGRGCVRSCDSDKIRGGSVSPHTCACARTRSPLPPLAALHRRHRGFRANRAASPIVNVLCMALCVDRRPRTHEA